MVYVIQTDPEVPPGTVADELAARPLPWKLVRLDRGESLPPVSIVTAFIILGGTMSVYDEEEFPFFRQLKAFIRKGVEGGTPCLGICLGGQLLAEAMGGRVERNRWGELGSSTIQLTEEGKKDLLFQGIDSPFPTFQWHNDSFDLPKGAVLLASSLLCPNQAFRIGPSACGVQFHPEVTPAIIAGWAEADAMDAGAAESLVADWRKERERHRQTISRMMRNFIRG